MRLAKYIIPLLGGVAFFATGAGVGAAKTGTPEQLSRIPKICDGLTKLTVKHSTINFGLAI